MPLLCATHLGKMSALATSAARVRSRWTRKVRVAVVVISASAADSPPVSLIPDCVHFAERFGLFSVVRHLTDLELDRLVCTDGFGHVVHCQDFLLEEFFTKVWWR
uniref:(northern house mosquito) hypothetical protein n=1 Tax=Culex pipiens TaxID=7175 RepID=A0A8D8NUP5_CULPI